VTTDSTVAAINRIAGGLVSPNELDSNGEPANVVDGLYAIARAINRLAASTCGCTECRQRHP
jgi:hypothetical protein